MQTMASECQIGVSAKVKRKMNAIGGACACVCACSRCVFKGIREIDDRMLCYQSSAGRKYRFDSVHKITSPVKDFQSWRSTAARQL